MRINLDKPIDLLLSNGNKAGELLGAYDATQTHSGWWAIREFDEFGAVKPEIIANIHISGFIAT